MNISFFRQKLTGTFQNKQRSTEASADSGMSRVFDPADLEILKNSSPKKREAARKSEFVALFRSRLNVVHTND